MSSSESRGQRPDSQREAEWAQIQEALRGLRYGAVNIVVQDGVVVQIDRTEKRRLRQQQHSTIDPHSAGGSR